MSFNLSIVTPTNHKSVDIEWVELQTQTGCMVIKKGHAPLIAILKPDHDVTFQLRNGVTELIEVPSGIAKIQRDNVTLIITQ